MLTILMGRAKTGKSEQVLRRIRELGDTSRQILLVPEHASHQAEVDLCRACGDTASRHAEVLSFRRLCDRVLTITGGAAQVTLDAGGKLLTLQKALGEVAPLLKVYRRPSQKASFLQQLLDLFDELRCYDVSPELLESQAREIQGATRDKLLDLSLLYGAYESRLYRPGLDARDRMTKLCEALESSRYAFGKDVFVDGFTYFNAQERQVLESILRQARSVTVTLLGEPDSAEEMFQVSLRTRDQLTRLADQAGCPWEVRTLTSADDSALGYLEHHFFGEGEPYQGDSSAIRVREADTAFSEVEQTAADIRRLVAAGKCRYRDITVAARNMTDYEGTIETVFERYSIPAYLSRRSSMLEKPVWSLITGVLSALENGLEYEDMFRWLKTGLAGLMPEECDELENYVLTWEIHGKMWLRDVDWTDNPDGYGAPWDKRRQARLDRVNELRRRVRAPLAELYEGLKAGVTAGEKVNSLYSFLEHLNLQNALEEQMRAQAEAGRLQDAEETAQLWEILAPSWTSSWRSWGTSLWGPMNSAACCGRWPPSTAWALSPCLWTRCPSRKSPEMTVTRMPTCFCWGPMTMCCPLWDRAAAFSTTMTGRNWPSGASAWRPAAWNRWALSSRTSTPLWFSPGRGWWSATPRRTCPVQSCGLPL